MISVTAAGWWTFSYHAWEYRGAGPLTDRGLFSYYRYRAPLGTFPFDRKGTYTFNFSGVPNETMILQLYVPGYSTDEREDIETLRTLIHAEITDGSGVRICTASGSPNGSGDNRWILYSSPFDAALWHEACRHEYHRRVNYTLRVALDDPDPRTPNVNLTAVLEGGGIELP